tara:strand:+ start:4642 stop:5145 length:504 start_codon:yes stop_codon:yes gene_type:complete
MEEIVNKVALAGLISLDIKDFYPKGVRASIDLKAQLWQGLVLKEKDFRVWVKETDWTEYEEKHVGVWCSADAIVPTWAYMLVASSLEGIASSIIFGDSEFLEASVVQNHIQNLDLAEYKDQRVIVKGCSDISAAEVAFLELTKALKPVVKSLMFGEACSSVPVYKRR